LQLREEQIIESVPVVIITHGAEGSVLHEGGRTERIPAIPVRVVDPTGAGDSYQAGFLTAYVRGYTSLDCCRVGAVTASFVIAHRGGQTNLPSWDEVMQRYRTNFKEIPIAANRRF
jgi:ribokinase